MTACEAAVTASPSTAVMKSPASIPAASAGQSVHTCPTSTRDVLFGGTSHSAPASRRRNPYSESSGAVAADRLIAWRISEGATIANPSSHCMTTPTRRASRSNTPAPAMLPTSGAVVTSFCEMNSPQCASDTPLKTPGAKAGGPSFLTFTATIHAPCARLPARGAGVRSVAFVRATKNGKPATHCSGVRGSACPSGSIIESATGSSPMRLLISTVPSPQRTALRWELETGSKKLPAVSATRENCDPRLRRLLR